MIFASAVVYYNKDKRDNVINSISNIKEIEIFDEDIDKTVLVVVLSVESDDKLSELEKLVSHFDGVLNFAYHASHFGEEAEKLEKGELKIDFNSINKKDNGKLNN